MPRQLINFIFFFGFNALAAAPLHTCDVKWVELNPYKEKILGLDTGAYYVAARFKSKDSLTLSLSGNYPHSRYFSIGVYESVRGTLISSMRDEEMIPDPGSINPFYPGVDRLGKSRRYTLTLSTDVTKAKFKNFLRLPNRREAKAGFTIWIRTYVPDADFLPSGGVANPSLLSESCPIEIFPSSPTQYIHSDLFAVPEGISSNSMISFARIGASTIYPNIDNSYLGAFLPPIEKSVGILTFKRPTTIRTLFKVTHFPLAKDLRYLSVCLLEALGNARSCLFDELLKEGDKTHIVLSGRNTEVMQRAKELNYDYLEVAKPNKRTKIAYRNLLATDFPGNIKNNVPICRVGTPPTTTATDCRAELYIRDYAPRIKICSITEFLGKNCF